MTWAPETDRRPRLVPVREIGERFDAAIGGIPVMLDWAGEGGFYNSLGSQDASGYEAQSAEIGIEQTSTSDDISENKLNESEFWRSLRDFRGGISQKRLDVPKVSSDKAYWESQGVDARLPGQLRLARKTTSSAPATFSSGSGSASTASNGFWFISETGVSTQAVTHYNFSTFTTKTRADDSLFREVCVSPDDICYIAADDGIWKVTTATSITQWCTQPAFNILVAKQRIFIIGPNGPTTANYAIYEVPLEGTAPVAATLKLNPGPGLIGSDVKEAGALVLFAYNPTPSYQSDPVGPGVIYGYDGTNAPTRMLTLPKGEEIACMHPILGGAQVLIFVRRMDANQSVRGVLYLVDVNGTSLQNARIVFEYPEEYTAFSPNNAISFGRHVLFAGAVKQSGVGGTGTGIDAYDIAEGSVSHLLLPPVVEYSRPIWVAFYKGRVAFGQSQSSALKVISESQTDYLASGTLETSLIDLNVDAPKLWSKVEIGCLPLKAGQKIEVYWTADDHLGATWTHLATLHPGQSSLLVPLGVQSAKLALRAKLYAPATPTSTPTLTKLGVAAMMARPPALEHHAKLLAYTEMDALNYGDFPGGEDYWARLSEALEGFRQTGEPVWWQPPESRHDGHVYRVRVGQMVRRMLNNPDKGQGGVIAVKMAGVEQGRRNLLPLAVASFASLPTTQVPLDVFETIGAGVTLAKETTLPSWSTGAPGFVKVTPNSHTDGIRGPAPHQQVPWDPIVRKGQPLSAEMMVRPYADNMHFQLIAEFWDAADNIEATFFSAVHQFGSGTAGLWLPLFLEDFNLDGFSELLFGTVQVLLYNTTGAVAAFGVDAGMLEQAFLATPWVPPPSNV